MNKIRSFLYLYSEVLWFIWMICMLIGFVSFIFIKILPDYKEATQQTYELYYGHQTYEIWRKINPELDLTYEEWVTAKKSKIIKLQ